MKVNYKTINAILLHQKIESHLIVYFWGGLKSIFRI